MEGARQLARQQLLVLEGVGFGEFDKVRIADGERDQVLHQRLRLLDAMRLHDPMEDGLRGGALLGRVGDHVVGGGVRQAQRVAALLVVVQMAHLLPAARVDLEPAVLRVSDQAIVQTDDGRDLLGVGQGAQQHVHRISRQDLAEIQRFVDLFLQQLLRHSEFARSKHLQVDSIEISDDQRCKNRF